MQAYISGTISGWNKMEMLELQMSFVNKGKTICLPVTWETQGCMDFTTRPDNLFILKLNHIFVNGMDVTGLIWTFRTTKLTKCKVKLYGKGQKDLVISKIFLYDKRPGRGGEGTDIFPDNYQTQYKVKREKVRWTDPLLKYGCCIR